MEAAQKEAPDRETEEAVSSIVPAGPQKLHLAKEEEENVEEDEESAEEDSRSRQEMLAQQHQMQLQHRTPSQELATSGASVYANSTPNQASSPTSSYQLLAPMSVANYHDSLAPSSNPEAQQASSTASGDPYASYMQQHPAALPSHANPVEAATPHNNYGTEPGFQEVHLASDQETHVNATAAAVAMNTALGYPHGAAAAAAAVPATESSINLDYSPMVNDYNPYSAAAAAAYAYQQRSNLPLQYASYSGQTQPGMAAWQAASIDAYNQHAASFGGGTSAWTQLAATNSSAVLASERYMVPPGSGQVTASWDSMDRASYPTLPSISQEFGFGGKHGVRTGPTYKEHLCLCRSF